MKAWMGIATAVIIAVGTGSAVAADSGLSLAQKNACMSCHSVDKKIVGPAYKDVAAKYKGDKGAEAKLIADGLDRKDEQQHVYRMGHVPSLCGEERGPLPACDRAHFVRWYRCGTFSERLLSPLAQR